MGFKYLGDSTLGVSLTMQTPKPLDTRLVVDTRADLYTIPSKYAYNGMPVVCVADGNIYTLIDKNKIKEAVGWKASYESILIVTCTELEYKQWLSNTNENFTPKDDSLTWLHQDTYYYIYEDSIEDKGLYYVSLALFEDLTNQVNKKATISALSELSSKIDQQLQEYATLKDIDDSNPDSKLSQSLSKYYTKTDTDDKFVTKDSLRGDGIEGDDFVFITKTLYDKDQESLKTFEENTKSLLDNKIDSDSDASLKSLTTKVIKFESNELTLDSDLLYNGENLAKEKNVPKIIVLDLSEYEELVNNTNDDFTPKDTSKDYILKDAYYYIREESIGDKGYHYVLYSQFEDLTNQVNKKASKDSLNSLSQTVEQQFEDLALVYATIQDIDITNKESTLSKALEDYYTKESANDIFVTKESLGNDGENYSFVSKSQYESDLLELIKYKEEVSTLLDFKVNSESDALLKSVSNNGTKLAIDKEVTINGDSVALSKNVPKIVVLEQEEYDNLENKETDVYYMTHGSDNNDGGVITSAILTLNYYTQALVIDIIKSTINLLCADNNLSFDYIHSVEVEKPTNLTFEYDGNIHTLNSTDSYNVVGNGGSDPGTYTFRVTLALGKWWTDGTNTAITVTYTINNIV